MSIANRWTHQSGDQPYATVLNVRNRIPVTINENASRAVANKMKSRTPGHDHCDKSDLDGLMLPGRPEPHHHRKTRRDSMPMDAAN